MATQSWYEEHCYHWFWGTIKRGPKYRYLPSLWEQKQLYNNDKHARHTATEIVISYYQSFFVIRFVHWLFNINNICLLSRLDLISKEGIWMLKTPIVIQMIYHHFLAPKPKRRTQTKWHTHRSSSYCHAAHTMSAKPDQEGFIVEAQHMADLSLIGMELRIGDHCLYSAIAKSLKRAFVEHHPDKVQQRLQSLDLPSSEYKAKLKEATAKFNQIMEAGKRLTDSSFDLNQYFIDWETASARFDQHCDELREQQKNLHARLDRLLAAAVEKGLIKPEDIPVDDAGGFSPRASK